MDKLYKQHIKENNMATFICEICAQEFLIINDMNWDDHQKQIDFLKGISEEYPILQTCTSCHKEAKDWHEQSKDIK